MYKTFTYMILSLLLVGCATEKSPKVKEQTKSTTKKQKEVKKAEVKKVQVKYRMFQTVDAKDAILVQDGKNRQYCVICGMDLIKFYKTSYAATYNEKEHQYCSIHCLSDHLGEGIEIKNPKVVDVTTLKLIPVLDAYYVVGSKKKGTMSKVSKYAFSTLKAAGVFQSKYGGEIMDFYGALEKAKEDFKHYR
jgi:nitrous oxide reductase accessory protein NosL